MHRELQDCLNVLHAVRPLATLRRLQAYRDELSGIRAWVEYLQSITAAEHARRELEDLCARADETLWQDVLRMLQETEPLRSRRAQDER